ncbi:MAG: PIG-L family deacetylase [Actinomycetes bacterium]|jgi:LmbE family N-acetylglucosaminyl deacetylase
MLRPTSQDFNTLKAIDTHGQVRECSMPLSSARTLVFFHAHPDDEAFLTAGTMARATKEGQRVVLVVATDGAAGLASQNLSDSLASIRAAELDESACILGVHRTIRLGFADSGLHGDEEQQDGGAMPLCRASIEEVAEKLAEILREENADVLITYDPNGGYGHPDHVRVHDVSVRAAEIADTPYVFEATAPRDLIVKALKLVSTVYTFPPEFDPTSFERAFSASAEITHRVNVRGYIDQKRASMRAHSSQATADSGDRTLAAFLRIPKPIFRYVFGTEYYVLRTTSSARSSTFGSS